MKPMRPLIYSALAYFAIGMASALISNPVKTPQLQAAMRLGALALGVLVYVAQIRHEIVRLHNSIRDTAFRSAGAVALGAFLLAVYAVLYNMIVRSRPFASIALLLIIWPLVAAVLGYLGAMVVARIVARWHDARKPS